MVLQFSSNLQARDNPSSHEFRAVFVLWSLLFTQLYGMCPRSNQSTLKEISPGISVEGMMIKFKLQYYGHLMRRVDSLEKTLMLGGIGGRRRIKQRLVFTFAPKLGRSCVSSGPHLLTLNME